MGQGTSVSPPASPPAPPGAATKSNPVASHEEGVLAWMCCSSADVDGVPKRSTRPAEEYAKAVQHVHGVREEEEEEEEEETRGGVHAERNPREAGMEVVEGHSDATPSTQIGGEEGEPTPNVEVSKGKEMEVVKPPQEVVPNSDYHVEAVTIRPQARDLPANTANDEGKADDVATAMQPSTAAIPANVARNEASGEGDGSIVEDAIPHPKPNEDEDAAQQAIRVGALKEIDRDLQSIQIEVDKKEQEFKDRYADGDQVPAAASEMFNLLRRQSSIFQFGVAPENAGLGAAKEGAPAELTNELSDAAREKRRRELQEIDLAAREIELRLLSSGSSNAEADDELMKLVDILKRQSHLLNDGLDTAAEISESHDRVHRLTQSETFKASMTPITGDDAERDLIADKRVAFAKLDAEYIAGSITASFYSKEYSAVEREHQTRQSRIKSSSSSPVAALAAKDDSASSPPKA